MKIAIHKSKGSFSERWIEYCKRNELEYKIVDCYRSDIIKQIKDCNALLWNWNNTDYKAMRFARQLVYSIESMGKKVFPNSKTCWHYDDKIGQKYLLEAIEAPFVQTNVFYDKNSALDWIESTTFPKVLKLSGGASAVNVKLVTDKREAIKYIHQAFGRGFQAIDRVAIFKDSFDFWLQKKNSIQFKKVLKTVARIFIKTDFEKMKGRERGYIYFQEFIPNNMFDIRVITVGNRAFAIKRMTRANDFRASGSGKIIYDKNQIDTRCVEIAFAVSKKIDAQCVAYDFIFNKKGEPLIVEISYAFLMTAYDKCEGYWDDSLNWYNEAFCPQEWMIKNLIS